MKSQKRHVHPASLPPEVKQYRHRIVTKLCCYIEAIQAAADGDRKKVYGKKKKLLDTYIEHHPWLSCSLVNSSLQKRKKQSPSLVHPSLHPNPLPTQHTVCLLSVPSGASKSPVLQAALRKAPSHQSSLRRCWSTLTGMKCSHGAKTIRPLSYCWMVMIDFQLPFLQYINDEKHKWKVFIGVPYGTSLWQAGDSAEQNGAYKISLSNIKSHLMHYKSNVGLSMAIVKSDIVPFSVWQGRNPLQMQHQTEKQLQRGAGTPLTMPCWTTLMLPLQRRANPL